MLEQLIAQHRAVVAERWFERVTATYPEQTTRFLREQKDPFANPMGSALRRGMRLVLDGLASGDLDRAPVARAEAASEGAPEDEGLVEGLVEGLDAIVRIRALQDARPSEAVAFVLELRQVLRDELLESERSSESFRAGSRLSCRIQSMIDQLLLLTIDILVERREQICQIRVNEIRNRSMKTLERLNEWRARRDEAAGLDAVD